jgi:hypothetical protein
VVVVVVVVVVIWSLYLGLFHVFQIGVFFHYCSTVTSILIQTTLIGLMN